MAQAAADHTSDLNLIKLGRRARVLEDNFSAFESDPRDYDEVPEMVAAEREHGKIMDRLTTTPATSLAGLQAKAERVLRWRDWNDPANEPDSDVALALSILRDLLAMEASTIQGASGSLRAIRAR